MKRLTAIALALLACGALAAGDARTEIVRKAQSYVGCSYRTGGTKPAEFDCSGFVGFIVRPFVPELPRLSRDMADSGIPIAKADLAPGDLVFFATTAVPGAISHVALYIGDGNIIHAISDGPQRGVNITPLDARYWKNHFARAVRVLPAAPAATAAPASPATGARTAAGSQTPGASPGAQAAPASPAPAAATARRKPSPWDSWDGYVEGDYAQWKAEQDRKFEESKKAYDKKKEQADFEAWKKTQGQ